VVVVEKQCRHAVWRRRWHSWWGNACPCVCAPATRPNVTGWGRRIRLCRPEIIANISKRRMAGTPGPIRRAWYQWKMQRFPWRKKWLVGEATVMELRFQPILACSL